MAGENSTKSTSDLGAAGLLVPAAAAEEEKEKEKGCFSVILCLALPCSASKLRGPGPDKWQGLRLPGTSAQRGGGQPPTAPLWRALRASPPPQAPPVLQVSRVGPEEISLVGTDPESDGGTPILWYELELCENANSNALLQQQPDAPPGIPRANGNVAASSKSSGWRVVHSGPSAACSLRHLQPGGASQPLTERRC
eukprot:jgi/Mesen1/3646/ME000200S02733